MTRIGQSLVEAGVVTSAQLDSALARQRAEGGPLGRHLMMDGAVSRLALYRELARQWQVPFVDLVADPPDPALLSGPDLETAGEEGWLPWRRDGDTLTIATCATPTPQVLSTAARRHGAAQVRAVATTDWDVTQAVQDRFRAELLHRAAEQFAEQQQSRSAKAGLLRWQRWVPAAVALAVLAGLVLNLWPTVAVVFAVANLAFAVNVAFKVLTALRAPSARRRRAREADTTRIPDHDLPVFTILVPAYHEANVIEKVLANLGALDYPQAKLDVLVLLEEDDIQTLAATKAVHPPQNVRILVVPAGSPQTKPRACNYGLAFARGRYLVVYDAEDRPDPDQLRVAVAAFRRDERLRAAGQGDGRPLVCVQAALNYVNADYNVLTRLFAVEYAHWFDAMLPGMDGLRIPIPLGGTSNHFDAVALAHVGAWDPYNVTEDADLGLRVDAAGFRVGTIDSVTWEEATARLRPWVRQRTRWIKGYIVTAAVNLRHPWTWLRRHGPRGAVTMFGLVLGTPLAFLLYPVAAAITLAVSLGASSPLRGLPAWLLTLGWVNMLVSTGAMVLISGLAAWRRYSWRIAVFALLNPLYWFGHAWAAWRAAWQTARDPHRWEKTPHGLTEEYEDTTLTTVHPARPAPAASGS